MNIPISSLPINDWLQREYQYSEFIAGPLQHFWSQRQEWCFLGVDNISLQCVRWCHSDSRKVIVIVSGFTETYFKYQELAYDLYHQGYDVMMYDHRGQGYSQRLLPAKPQRVYVEHFSDYVDDLTLFWQDFVLTAGYQQRYLLAHSMGGAISGLFLARYSHWVTAAILSAPMVGIQLPMPVDWAKAVANAAERWLFMRQAYALYARGMLPFSINTLTHSRARYDYFGQLRIEQPDIWLNGPTYHWVKEAIAAGEQLLQQSNLLTLPLLLMQADQEQLVSNQAQLLFYQQRQQAGLHTNTAYLITDDQVQSANGEGFIRFKGCRHEILFERDEIRVAALSAVLRFFAHHC